MIFSMGDQHEYCPYCVLSKRKQPCTLFHLNNFNFYNRKIRNINTTWRVDVFLSILAWDDEGLDWRRGGGGRRRGGYVKTHNKHKSSFNMAHSNEHGRETVRRFRREDDDVQTE